MQLLIKIPKSANTIWGTSGALENKKSQQPTKKLCPFLINIISKIDTEKMLLGAIFNFDCPISVPLEILSNYNYLKYKDIDI